MVMICTPDFEAWWREGKSAGYTPADFERDLRFFTAQASISSNALTKAVQATVRRLRDMNLQRLNMAIELDWKRANSNA